MKNLYLLGGSSRSGKTTVVNKMAKIEPIVIISTDAVRCSVRSAIFDEPYVTVEELQFNGHVRFRRPGNKDNIIKEFSNNIDEDALTWKGVLGFIDHYDRKDDMDVLIEGIAITPERIHSLKLKNLKLKVAFSGYTDNNYAEVILSHARSNDKDWINKWLKEEGGDTTKVKEWVEDNVNKNKILKEVCDKYGYKFFNLSEKNFEQHIHEILEYLLKS